mmetsp:Transcript_17029/g.24954  ORF Transcript_17029/g.24954 Transcript_17029/m.24954 type:complete len:309 (+) Transcript_17029:243-1169(+)
MLRHEVQVPVQDDARRRVEQVHEDRVHEVGPEGEAGQRVPDPPREEPVDETGVAGDAQQAKHAQAHTERDLGQRIVQNVLRQRPRRGGFRVLALLSEHAHPAHGRGDDGEDAIDPNVDALLRRVPDFEHVVGIPRQNADEIRLDAAVRFGVHLNHEVGVVRAQRRRREVLREYGAVRQSGPADDEPRGDARAGSEQDQAHGDAGRLGLVVRPNEERGDDEELHVVGEIPRPVHASLRRVGRVEVVDEEQVRPPVGQARCSVLFNHVPQRSVADVQEHSDEHEQEIHVGRHNPNEAQDVHQVQRRAAAL